MLVLTCHYFVVTSTRQKVSFNENSARRFTPSIISNFHSFQALSDQTSSLDRPASFAHWKPRISSCVRWYINSRHRMLSKEKNAAAPHVASIVYYKVGAPCKPCGNCNKISPDCLFVWHTLLLLQPISKTCTTDSLFLGLYHLSGKTTCLVLSDPQRTPKT